MSKFNFGAALANLASMFKPEDPEVDANRTKALEAKKALLAQWKSLEANDEYPPTQDEHGNPLAPLPSAISVEDIEGMTGEELISYLTFAEQEKGLIRSRHEKVQKQSKLAAETNRLDVEVRRPIIQARQREAEHITTSDEDRRDYDEYKRWATRLPVLVDVSVIEWMERLPAKNQIPADSHTANRRGRAQAPQARPVGKFFGHLGHRTMNLWVFGRWASTQAIIAAVEENPIAMLTAFTNPELESDRNGPILRDGRGTPIAPWINQTAHLNDLGRVQAPPQATLKFVAGWANGQGQMVLEFNENATPETLEEYRKSMAYAARTYGPHAVDYTEAAQYGIEVVAAIATPEQEQERPDPNARFTYYCTKPGCNGQFRSPRLLRKVNRDGTCPVCKTTSSEEQPLFAQDPPGNGTNTGETKEVASPDQLTALAERFGKNGTNGTTHRTPETTEHAVEPVAANTQTEIIATIEEA